MLKIYNTQYLRIKANPKMILTQQQINAHPHPNWWCRGWMVGQPLPAMHRCALVGDMARKRERERRERERGRETVFCLCGVALVVCICCCFMPDCFIINIIHIPINNTSIVYHYHLSMDTASLSLLPSYASYPHAIINERGEWEEPAHTSSHGR